MRENGIENIKIQNPTDDMLFRTEMEEAVELFGKLQASLSKV